MTLVQYFVDFFRPYADMPEFTTCVMKALKEVGHGVTEKSMYIEETGSISEKRYSELSTKSCRIADKEVHTVIASDSCNE